LRASDGCIRSDTEFYSFDNHWCPVVLVSSLQYLVREHMVEDGMPPQLKSMGNSIIRKSAAPAITPYSRLRYFVGILLCLFQGPDEMLKLRWNSQSGAVYVDGQHFKVRNGYCSIQLFASKPFNGGDCKRALSAERCFNLFCSNELSPKTNLCAA
jgi:hypothetical protein